MKIRTTLDVVEIPGEKVDAAIRRLVLEETGREMDQIVWANPVEMRNVGVASPIINVNLNATLKPESK
jgi:hypothetical protein